MNENPRDALSADPLIYDPQQRCSHDTRRTDMTPCQRRVFVASAEFKTTECGGFVVLCIEVCKENMISGILVENCF